jgi:23S rRNA pseudouridine1911/1915/1917 synthase
MQVEDAMLSATLRAFPRQALHAHRMALTHPITRERVEVEAPLPEDMRRLLECAALTPTIAGHGLQALPRARQ